MNPFAMTGLELLRAMHEGHIPPASISQIIPMRGTDMTAGVFRMEAHPKEHATHC